MHVYPLQKSSLLFINFLNIISVSLRLTKNCFIVRIHGEGLHISRNNRRCVNKLTIFVVVLSGGVLAAYLGELEAICFSSIFENLKN